MAAIRSARSTLKRRVAAWLLRVARTDMRSSDAMTAVTTFVWGLSMAVQPKIFDLPAYHEFRVFHLSAWALGTIILSIGTDLGLGVALADAKLRRVGLVLAGALWTFMSGCFWLARVPGTSPYLCSVLMLFAMFSFATDRFREIAPEIDADRDDG